MGSTALTDYCEMYEKSCEALGPLCPFSRTMLMIGGKWKTLVLFEVGNGRNRFGILSRNLRGITKKMLTTQLRELEEDGLLDREVFPEVPPRVEYSLTPLGQSLLPILQQLADWGIQHIDEAELAPRLIERLYKGKKKPATAEA